MNKPRKSLKREIMSGVLAAAVVIGILTIAKAESHSKGDGVPPPEVIHAAQHLTHST